jgi:hypothetical protein
MSATPVLANHPSPGLANGQQRNTAVLIKGLGSKSSIIHMDHETRDYRLSLGAKRFQKHYNHFFIYQNALSHAVIPFQRTAFQITSLPHINNTNNKSPWE